MSPKVAQLKRLLAKYELEKESMTRGSSPSRYIVALEDLIDEVKALIAAEET